MKKLLIVAAVLVVAGCNSGYSEYDRDPADTTTVRRDTVLRDTTRDTIDNRRQ